MRPPFNLPLTIMSVAFAFVVVITAAGSIGFGPGCEAIQHVPDWSPQQRWAAAAELYTGTMKALTQLKKAGYLTVEDKTTIEPFRVTARGAIDKMESAVATGDTGAFSIAHVAFSGAIDVLLTWQARAQIEKRNTDDEAGDDPAGPGAGEDGG